MRRARVGSLLVAVGTFAGAATQWYLVWLFARRGGAAAVGSYSALFALATPLYVVAGLGLRNLWLTHEIATSLFAYLRLRLVGLAIISAVLVVAEVWAGSAGALLTAVVAMKVFDSLLDLLYGWFQARRDNLTLGLLLTGNPLLSALAATVVMVTTRNMAGAVAASAVVSGVFVIVAAVLIRDWGGHSRWFPDARILRDAVPVTTAQLLMSVLGSIPTWLVQYTGTRADVGRYAGAAYLLVAANLLGSTIQTLRLPVLRSELSSGGPASLLSDVRRWALACLAAGLPAAVLVVFAGPPLLRFVYGGPAFMLSRGELVGLALAAVLTVGAYLFTSSLLVLNAYGTQLAVSALAVAGSLGIGWAAAGLGAVPVQAGCLAAFGGALVRAGSGWVCVRHVAKNFDAELLGGDA